MGKKNAAALTPIPSLFQHIEAIQAAISAGLVVEVNVSGALRRVLGINVTDGMVSLLFHHADGQLVIFRVQPGTRITFQVTLPKAESEEPS